MPESGLMKPEVVRAGSASELADSVASSFAEIITQAVENRGVASVALSGGSTPKAIYNRLVREDYLNSLPWDKINFFVSDERCVPLSSEESNFGNAQRLLLSKIKATPWCLHFPSGQETDAVRAAQAYEKVIIDTVTGGSDAVPRFDLIFLGMGPDGHTASLFPGTKALDESKRLVIENFVPHLDANRITFTYRLLNAARNVIFVVAGEDKSAVVKEILEGSGEKYPAARVTPKEGINTWMLDAAAASKLTT